MANTPKSDLREAEAIARRLYEANLRHAQALGAMEPWEAIAWAEVPAGQREVLVRTSAEVVGPILLELSAAQAETDRLVEQVMATEAAYLCGCMPSLAPARETVTASSR